MANKFEYDQNKENRRSASMHGDSTRSASPSTEECFEILKDMGLASRYGIRLVDGKLTHENKDGYFLS